ncbi:DUF4124 domain-containing protein [Aquipseudomonas alcaligenes]|uniref:DUF4124 domain-containing protein n=1 Tax=Aquipseudomonas alcaligenes TaxID=43263 RepID=A0AA37FLE3_AQUAC|nr:DUF4124 domain-containing protein [Pseudomonas alcaligenes]BCR22929.1 hypothetical protein KAM426_04560 [Pseudomonas alcaligenes]GIZ67282.1 hypothetical protein KAM428_23670 [Pseudomonas alcaligenes]GIZ70957.1 hypothetical protein KAM429_17180 [Pseudomonas alcaligenes]GIZ75304.1 hypothetical protein KAM430_17130 [Pseudomonas alcaligenes]GIZ80039.1 hypothetical protein KAM432_20870 [Pseudomonas alcaligenes]
MRLLTACLLCTLALPATAQIYKYTDANGNTVFTNQPPEGQASESVELKPTNTVEAQQPVVEQPKDAEEKRDAYSRLALKDIPSEDALRANNGTFMVGVDIEPRLRPGHSLRLLLDGQPYGQPSNVPRLQLSEIDRGEHTLAVEVLSGQRQVQQSESVTFTVQRISLNSPARAKPTPPKPTPKPAN